jgi:hypothetical protein
MSYADIPGFSGFLWLYKEAVHHFPANARFVEVGVALGHSVAYLARLRLDAGHTGPTYAVDPWGGTARNGEQQELLGENPDGDFELFLDLMQRHAPEEFERLTLVRTTSVEAANAFPRASVDCLLIDGCHAYESVLADIRAWVPRMKPDGWMGGDDHEPNYPGVEKAVREVFGDRYEVQGTTWVVRGGF